jgi:hypothetical protein
MRKYSISYDVLFFFLCVGGWKNSKITNIYSQQTKDMVQDNVASFTNINSPRILRSQESLLTVTKKILIFVRGAKNVCWFSGNRVF